MLSALYFPPSLPVLNGPEQHMSPKTMAALTKSPAHGRRSSSGSGSLRPVLPFELDEGTAIDDNEDEDVVAPVTWQQAVLNDDGPRTAPLSSKFIDVPFFARARMSRLLSAAGMASSWIGDGRSKPASKMPISSSRRSFMSSNSMPLMFCTSSVCGRSSRGGGRRFARQPSALSTRVN